MTETSNNHVDEQDDTEPRMTEVDQGRIEAAVREILDAIGEDSTRDGLLDTPARVARMYAEISGGLHLSLIHI